MPEKKIIDAVTSTSPVIGSSMATATAGPMPGSTPTAVPSAQPNRAHSRLAGVMATAKPCRSAFRMSMACSDPAGVGQAREVDRQESREHPVHRRRDGKAGEQVHQQRPRAGHSRLLGGAAQPLYRQQVAQGAAEDEA